MFKVGDKVLFTTGITRYKYMGVVTETCPRDHVWKEPSACVQWHYRNGGIASVSWVRQSHLRTYNKAIQTRRWNELKRLSG